MFKTIAEIRKAASSDASAAPFWFDQSTMDFFNTRVIDGVFSMGDFGSLFITADRPDTDVPEGFAIRWAHVHDGMFQITTLGDIMQYRTIAQAAHAAEIATNVLPDIVRFSR